MCLSLYLYIRRGRAKKTAEALLEAGLRTTLFRKRVGFVIKMSPAGPETYDMCYICVLQSLLNRFFVRRPVLLMTKSPVIQENSGKTRAPGINGLGGVIKICIIIV